jgi:hypothetical protein
MPKDQAGQRRALLPWDIEDRRSPELQATIEAYLSDPHRPAVPEIYQGLDKLDRTDDLAVLHWIREMGHGFQWGRTLLGMSELTSSPADDELHHQADNTSPRLTRKNLVLFDEQGGWQSPSSSCAS